MSNPYFPPIISARDTPPMVRGKVIVPRKLAVIPAGRRAAGMRATGSTVERPIQLHSGHSYQVDGLF